MELMLKKLEVEPGVIPSPSRDQNMKMTVEALDTLSIDSVKAFKSLFVTNALDGTEDFLVSDKIFRLVGQQLVQFRTKLMKQNTPKTLTELLNTITPPKGIKRKNIEGSELLDCDSDENEDIDEDLEDDELENSKISEAFQAKDPEVERNESHLPIKTPKLSNLCEDPETNKDAEFLDRLQVLIESYKTSKLFTPHISKLRNMNHEARNSVKKRIQKFKSETKNDAGEPGESIEFENAPSDNLATTSDDTSKPLPRVGEFWIIRNGIHTLFSTIATENPLSVQYFEPSHHGKYHVLDDKEYEVFFEDFEKRIPPPSTIHKGSRIYYIFSK